MFNVRVWARFIVSLAGIAAAILFGHFVVYRAIIVPELPELRSVPLWMWLGSLAPEGLVVLAVGTGLRSWRSIVSYAAGASLVRVSLLYSFAITHQPGHLKSFEAPVEDFAISLTVWAVVYACAFALTSAQSRHEAPHARRFRRVTR